LHKQQPNFYILFRVDCTVQKEEPAAETQDKEKEAKEEIIDEVDQTPPAAEAPSPEEVTVDAPDSKQDLEVIVSLCQLGVK
jgi:hypothetical protein